MKITNNTYNRIDPIANKMFAGEWASPKKYRLTENNFNKIESNNNVINTYLEYTNLEHKKTKNKPSKIMTKQFVRANDLLTSVNYDLAQANDYITYVNNGFAQANEFTAHVNEGIARVNDELAYANDELAQENDDITYVNDDTTHANDELAFINKEQENSTNALEYINIYNY